MADTWLREYDYCGKYIIEGRFVINSSNNNVILLIMGYAAEYVFDCNLKENTDDTKALFDAACSLYTKELGNKFFEFIASLCFAQDHLDTILTS
jgi:hypothetical protein